MRMVACVRLLPSSNHVSNHHTLLCFLLLLLLLLLTVAGACCVSRYRAWPYCLSACARSCMHAFCIYLASPTSLQACDAILFTNTFIHIITRLLLYLRAFDYPILCMCVQQTPHQHVLVLLPRNPTALLT